MVTTTSSISTNMIQLNNISPSPNVTSTGTDNSTATRRVGDNRRVSISNFKLLKLKFFEKFNFT